MVSPGVGRQLTYRDVLRWAVLMSEEDGEGEEGTDEEDGGRDGEEGTDEKDGGREGEEGTEECVEDDEVSVSVCIYIG